MAEVAEAIRGKLSRGLQPSRLSILDDSDRHAGHAGARAGGESHFTIEIESETFAGMGRVQRQRLVMGLLADELAGPVHALSIKAVAPGES